MPLLVADGEFALRLLVVVREVLQFPDGLSLQYRRGEFDVGFGVLVTGLVPTVSLRPSSFILFFSSIKGRAPGGGREMGRRKERGKKKGGGEMGRMRT